MKLLKKLSIVSCPTVMIVPIIIKGYRRCLRKINEARKAEISKNKENKEQDNMQILGEAKHAMKDIQDMNQKMPDSLTLQEQEKMLNADQKRVYDNIRNTLIHQKEHEEGQCLCDYKPFTMFVSGVGGTGKSFLIEAIKAFLNLFHKLLRCPIAFLVFPILQKPKCIHSSRLIYQLCPLILFFSETQISIPLFNKI